MKPSFRTLILVFSILFMTVGCGAEAMYSRQEMDVPAAVKINDLANDFMEAKGDPDSAGLVQFSPDPDKIMATTTRQVIYSGIFTLLVNSAPDTLRTIKSVANDAGGYFLTSTNSSITIKVPAKTFDSTIARLRQLGDVTSEHIGAKDVTEKMMDLNIRLDNAEKIRLRYANLLEKAQTVEETIKVEAALEKATVKVELLKGKLNYLKQQVALSTITVNLNTAVAQSDPLVRTPFPWVQQMGNEISTAFTGRLFKNDSWWNGLDIDLPKKYIKYSEREDELRAMSATNLNVKIHRHNNYDKGDIEFWSELVTRNLKKRKAIKMTKKMDLKVDIKGDAWGMSGVRATGGTTYGYFVGLCVTEKDVYTIEIWGDIKEYDNSFQKLFESMETLSAR